MSGNTRADKICPEAKELLDLIGNCQDIESLRWSAERIIGDVGFKILVQGGGFELDGVREAIQRLKEST